MQGIEHVLPTQHILGEGPIWSEKEQALYWVDILGQSYSRLEPSSGDYETIHVGTPIGVLAQRTAGGLVMATGQGFVFWDDLHKTLVPLAHPEADRPHMRFNDGAVDCSGRFWAGTKSEADDPQAEGALYRLDPDGSVHRMLTGLGIPNGIGWSPDNAVMYVTDTAEQTIYAFDFEALSGEMANRRVLVSLRDVALWPDGLAVDSQGYLWSACWDGAKIVRLTPTGSIERVIEVPVPCPTSCTFGGHDLDELYITSASVGLTPEQRSRFPFSGDLFRLKTGIRGLGHALFAG